jgi:hypothetical protein
MTPIAIRSELLLLLARADPDDAIRARIATLATVIQEWDALLALAARHRVLPTVLRNVPPTMPAPAAARLRAACAENGGHALRLAAALRTILDALGRHGVVAMPYKGPVLAAQLYGDVARRQYADLDLLVQPAQIPDAQRVLEQLGYQGDSLRAWQTGLLRRNAHCVVHTGMEGDVVELHWRVTGRDYPVALDLDRLWSRASTLSLAGREIPVPCPEDLLAMLCAHGAKHAWERLGWICDIDALLRTTPEINWPALLDDAERRGYVRLLLWGVDLAATLLGTRRPPPVERQLARQPRVAALTGLSARRLFEPPVAHWRRVALAARIWPRRRTQLALLANGLWRAGPSDWRAAPLPDTLRSLHSVIRPLRLMHAHAIRPALRSWRS